ncbi:MAG: adenylate/guanylate cyclase domain-containing protein [Deltaproteobacteria bacterium]|nr:adenylate/guanylate cyclase domain-containing protein [Deltaproteobacteria bacterium]
MRTQNLAILLTDIAGFTAATARQTREQNAAWLATHAQLLRPVFAAFNGTVRKELGDAFLVTFPSPTDAVLAATAVLDRLWAYNQSAAALMRLKVRVVVNMGEVRLDKSEILGEPVNVAARVEDVADGGDITLTEAVYLTMNRSEVELEPLGPHTLKDVQEPVNLYRVKQVVPRPAEGELHASYPYGGTQLHRVAAAEAAPPSRGNDLRGTARDRISVVNEAFQRWGGARLVGRVAALLVLLAGVGAGAKMGWDTVQNQQADPFRLVADRVQAGDLPGASQAWDDADEKKAEPAWKLDYYLGRISALEGECGDVMDAYRRAVKAHEPLAEDEALARDVVKCVDTVDGSAAKFIRKWLGKKAALPWLRAAARDGTRPAQARLAVLSMLDEMGEPNAVDQGAVLVELLRGDHPCKQRREAVLRLAARREKDALDALRAELKDSEGEGKRVKANGCLVGALGEAVRTIEGG